MLKKKKNNFNFTHFKVCVRRYYQLILSDKVSAVMLMLQAPLMLLILSLVCRRDCFSSPEILYEADTAMFVIVLMSTMMGLLNAYREVCKEREVLLREYDAGLDITAYFLSKLFVLGSVCLIQSLILSVGSNLIIDFPNPHPIFTQLLYWFTLFFVMFTAAITGLFISSILKSSDSAVLPVLLVLIMQVVMAGYPIELSGLLKTFSIFCVSRWGLTSLGNIFNRNELFPELLWTIKDIYTDSIWLCYLALFIMCITLTAISIFVLKLSFRKKYKSK